MSSDRELERLLREVRAILPEPDGNATVRAWEAARGAASSRRRRGVRVAAALTVFALAVVGGIAIGALAVPSGNAAKEPVGLGFLPAPGWQAFQTGTEASAIYQTVAVASNVPLASEDLRAGAAEASGLPYTTLQGLPVDGVVMVASFTRDDHNSFPAPPKRALPLTLADASHYVPYGTQVRPDEPLGQWHLRAAVRGRVVDVVVYFGTQVPSVSLLADANRQLAQLVVDPVSQRVGRATAAQRAAPATRAAGTRVVERTLTCTLGMQGGARVLNVTAQSGLRKEGTFQWLAQASVTTAGSPLPSQRNEYRPQLVAMTAGYPPPAPLTSGGLGFSTKLCAPSRLHLPFSTRGLDGGVAGQIAQEATCVPATKVLVHFRAVFTAPVSVEVDQKARFASAVGRVATGRIAVATIGGKPLVYTDVSDSGAARLFTARSCT